MIQRVVLDTNALVSRLLLPKSIPGDAVRKAIAAGQVLMSEATMDELAAVLARPKFAPYVSIGDRQQFIRLLGRLAEIVPVTHVVRACRDSKDDKFLELAVNGGANILVTGDKDLLALHPFRKIAIIAPALYLLE